MRFDWPQMLLLLPVVGWLLWRRHRRPVAAIAFSSLALVAPEAVSWRTRWAWLPEAMRAAALCVLVFGLARPQWEITAYSRTTRGVAIELLTDISSSMDMTFEGGQGKLNRLDAVKQVLEKFILGDPQTALPGRPNDLLGLVTFARYADTVSPQTEAHDALAELIRNLTIEDRPNEDGTAYGDAVTLAAAHLHKLDDPAGHAEPGAGVKSRVIVLLTDGENNCGRHLPLEATALAKQWGIRIYVISLADSGGVGGLPKGGASAPSTAEQILMRMATETGGVFRRAGDLDSLAAVYREIDTLEKSEIRIEKNTRWRELHPWFTALALLLAVGEMVSNATLWRRIP